MSLLRLSVDRRTEKLAWDDVVVAVGDAAEEFLLAEAWTRNGLMLLRLSTRVSLRILEVRVHDGGLCGGGACPNPRNRSEKCVLIW